MQNYEIYLRRQENELRKLETHLKKLSHLCRPVRSTFAVRETYVSRHNGGTSGAPLKPLRDDSTLRALMSLRTIMFEWWA